MNNLAGWNSQQDAGLPSCDTIVAGELALAGIPVIRGEVSKIEVATSITGRIGRPPPDCYSAKLHVACIVLHRAWYYWVAKGLVPLEVALRLYADPIGRKDVRVNGDCGCPPPEGHQLTWRDTKGHLLVVLSDEDKQRIGIPGCMRELFEKSLKAQNAIVVDDVHSVPGARAYVNYYHIDSQEGLNLFAAEVTRDHDEG